MTPMILIGAGGHAKVIADALTMQGIPIAAYVDPKPCDWLNAKRINEEELAALLPSGPALVMAYVGLTCEALESRYQLMQDYKQRGAVFPPVIHPHASVSAKAQVGDGVQIMAGAVVASGAQIGECAVVNSRGLVEHDAELGAGAHVAPGAVVLGGARVGKYAFVGSNAVVMLQTAVPAAHFIKALTVHA